MTDNQIILTSAEWKNLLAIDDFRKETAKLVRQTGAGNEIVSASVFNKKWKLGNKGIPKEPTNKTKRSMAIIDSSGKIKSVPTDNPELN